jgi:hypothetical protein
MLNNIYVVLRPLNVKARIVLVMKPRQEEFKRPMFDIKVDLDEISLNINRDQVYSNTKHRFFLYLPVFFFVVSRFT